MFGKYANFGLSSQKELDIQIFYVSVPSSGIPD